jgi:hypothetical protein
MAKSILSGILAATAFLGIVGCSFSSAEDRIKGSGVSVTEQRTVNKFDRISLRGSGDLSVTIGEAASVSVSGDDNVVSIIKTEVSDGQLVIEPAKSYSSKSRLKVEVVVPSLTALSIAGSGDAVVTGLNESETVDLSITGSGDLKANGSVGELKARVAGSGALELRELKARTASVSVSGSGDVRVFASETLSVSVAGSGDVRYYGEPKNVQRSISGSGSVKPG